VKLMPPKYVKANLERGETDASDVAAACALSTHDPTADIARLGNLRSNCFSAGV